MTEDVQHVVRIAVLEEQLKAMREDTAKQATEYERRLTELNHAHARAAEDKNRFMTTELFYANKEAVQKWQNEMDQWRAKVIGIAVGAGMVSGIAGGTVAGMLAKLFQ